MPNVLDWSDLAEWYDGRIGDVGDLRHRELIDPTLIALVGDPRGLSLLDLGCGNGYLARRFARQGARVVGVDSSAPVVALARERERAGPLGVVYHVHDAADLPMFSDASFDLVYSNMAIMDMPDAVGPLRESARLLRPGGRFVASLCHPCFDVPNASSWLWEREAGPGGHAPEVSRRVWKYRVPFDEPVLWRVPEREEFLTRSFHRPISWYVRELWRAGLAVTAMEEPDGTDRLRTESPQGNAIHEVPLHVVIEARKFPDSPVPRG